MKTPNLHSNSYTEQNLHI